MRDFEQNGHLQRVLLESPEAVSDMLSSAANPARIAIMGQDHMHEGSPAGMEVVLK